MSDTVNDYIYAALNPTYADNITSMLLQWRRANSLDAFDAYVAHVQSETGVSNFTDAEWTFWSTYAGGGPTPPSANLFARYIADTGVTTASGRITQWNDQGPGGYHLTNGTSNGPTAATDWLSRPVVRFTQPNGDIIFNSSPNYDVRSKSAFLVMRNNAVRAFGNGIELFGPTSNYGGLGGGGAPLRYRGTTATTYFLSTTAVTGSTLPQTSSLDVVGFAPSASDTKLYTMLGSETVAAITSDTSVDGWFVGGRSNGLFIPNAEIYEVLIYDTQTPDVAGIREYVTAKYGVSATLPAKQIVCEGDSITQGVSTGGTSTLSWPFQLTRSSNDTWRVTNLAIAGSKVADLVTRAAGTDAYYSASHSRNVLMVLIGRNDVGLDTEANIYAALVSYVQARVAAGWEVWVGTCITTSGAAATQIVTLNGLIKGTSGNGIVVDAGATQVVDFHALPEFDAGSSSDATYYAVDQTHTTPAGALKMADLVAPLLT